MIELPVWIDSNYYLAGGRRRQVGDVAEFDLCFAGEVRADSGAEDAIAVLGDGIVELTGVAVGLTGSAAHPHSQATYLRAGRLYFTVFGWLGVQTKVRCTGRLWDGEDARPSARLVANVLAIRWRPIFETIGPDGEVDDDGFVWGEGRMVKDTGEVTDLVSDWAFEMTVSF
jgi:hypothetical protein